MILLLEGEFYLFIVILLCVFGGCCVFREGVGIVLVEVVIKGGDCFGRELSLRGGFSIMVWWFGWPIGDRGDYAYIYLLSFIFF